MPPDLFSPLLDYGHVDGIGRARQRSIPPQLGDQILRGSAIGPLIELTHLGCSANDDLRDVSWLDAGSLGPLHAAMAGSSQHWLQGDGRCGLIKAQGIVDETTLRSFKIDAHKAALAAGFDRAAPLLVAAIGELVGNIVDHSQAVATGVVAFLGRPNSFEFVVADCGIGVLSSLHQSPDYLHLGDEGQALAAMVEPGVSRYDVKLGHGNGFRPIFERLADMQGQLRFRSGDHALTLDGRFGDRVARQVSQRPKLRGFLTAISCRNPETSGTAAR